jgi:hypothetical protein
MVEQDPAEKEVKIERGGNCSEVPILEKPRRGINSAAVNETVAEYLASTSQKACLFKF